MFFKYMDTIKKSCQELLFSNFQLSQGVATANFYCLFRDALALDYLYRLTKADCGSSRQKSIDSSKKHYSTHIFNIASRTSA